MSKRRPPAIAPILANKEYDKPSAFTPESLLREARRQKAMGEALVPAVCVLDPDGDIVRRLKADGRARPHPGWACYHTELHVFEEDANRMARTLGDFEKGEADGTIDALAVIRAAANTWSANQRLGRSR